jgi:hypothetical protein
MITRRSTRHIPQSEKEWESFEKNCARMEDKDLRQWGLDMHRMNIGSLTLGRHGYDRKMPRWGKEDANPLMGGEIKPWEKFEDRRQRDRSDSSKTP